MLKRPLQVPGLDGQGKQAAKHLRIKGRYPHSVWTG